MRRVKSFWRKDTKTNLKYNSKNNHHQYRHNNKNVQIFNTCLDPNNPIVPNIVIQTIAYIEQYAINENGLFRVFGNQTDVNSLKLAFEKYETIDLSKISNPHIVTSVLKLYLRELPEPLFTFNSYEALIVSHGISDTDMRLTVIKSIIQKIVPHHLVVLEYIFAFLCRVVINSKSNHMDSSNLAIIFAPTLLKSKSETAEKLIADSPRSTSIIKIIIDNYSEIFEKDSLTGDHVQPAKSTTPFFEQDYLLSIKYETINLDKEIAEILKEEEDLAKSVDGGELTSSSVSACGGNVNSRLHSSSKSNHSRPSVFQVFDSSNTNTSIGGIASYNGSRLSIISNDSSASSPDMSEYDDGEEEEELKKPPGSTVISPSIIPQQGHYEEEIDDEDEDQHDHRNHNNQNDGNNEIEFKIQVIKELIDKTILELQNEFIQLEKDLQDSCLSFQEILLVASSLKSIMQILIEGPDVDSQVVSFDENVTLPLTGDDEDQQQQIKRLEILKKAILLKINSSIPSLLLELKDESYSLTIQLDIGKDICLVDLITIMRTLRSVNDVLDFFFSKWSIIESISPSSPYNNKKHHHHQSSPINSSPKLTSTPQSNSPPQTPSTATITTNTTTTANTSTTSTPNNSSIISNNNGGMFNEKEEFIISIQPNEQDIVSNICDIDMVLFEAEETLMGISSKSELIYIAKVVQNLQKVVRTPIKISPGSFDEIAPPKINTLKITPKHKLAPLVSVVYVLIKEIRDQMGLLRTGFQNSTLTQKQQLVNHYCSRLLDVWRVLSKLPAFNSYKTSYRNRQEISMKNCQHMRETIESTLWKLVPLFSQLKVDVLEKHDITCDNLIVISKSVTKIKKIFEDSQISSRTSIKFSPFSSSSKTNPINLSNDNFNLNGSNGGSSGNSINDKITTLKNLTASIVDQVITRFSQIEKHFNEINQENYLYEITDILKLVITNFKDIKLLNI